MCLSADIVSAAMSDKGDDWPSTLSGTAMERAVAGSYAFGRRSSHRAASSTALCRLLLSTGSPFS